jgi:nitroreductase
VLKENTTDVYRRIVAAAVLAPSAENVQPWQFVVRDDALTVLLDRTRTLASDIGDMLSLTAVGTCIENAVIAATSLGFSSSVDYLADDVRSGGSSTATPIARIRFSEGATLDPLADSIELRCTSRRLEERPLEESLLNELEESCRVVPSVHAHWVDRERLGQFAELIGIGNRIRFEHEPFHEELYRNLRFTAAEAERTRDGLDVATLQLPAALAWLLSALRTWRRMKIFNALFGFSRTAAKQTAKEVRCSGAVGFLTIPTSDTKAYVEGGRAVERIWLSATRLGLGFHPTASLPVFLAYARTGAHRQLPRHEQVIADMAERFQRMYPDLADRTVQMAFRIGYVREMPAARSLRRKVEDVLRFE